ncbi:hypothetical protein BDW22DRAFT_1351451 [Trametopsis cervina]|nr:hypothetical protein BDW22DRAFT_1351451 [Trametopsis cervina]
MSEPDLTETNLQHGDESATTTTAQELLLIIFIHGFKGTDSTFGRFPERLQHTLSTTIQNVHVESIPFPAYETKGELNAAVIRFADWLTQLTVEKEVAHGTGGGAGKARIVLCGHSMGGLLAADALIEFVRTRADQTAPLWPNIIACLAFDTPYLGLHPSVFKNRATQAASYVQQAHELFTSGTSFFGKKSVPPPVPPKVPIAALPAPPSAADSGWKKWTPAAYAVGGALLAAGAAGAAYYKRDDIGVGYTWATDHMKYVGNLWDEGRLRQRLDELFKIEEEMGVMFRTFYTYLPPAHPSHPTPRTFIILPRAPSKYVSHFLQAPNSIAGDEIEAHTGMFDGKTNDGYYELGLITAQLLRDVMVASRSDEKGAMREVAKHPPAEDHALKLGDDKGAQIANDRGDVEGAGAA